ncbi:MAG: ABC transporter substrate-binding protein [Phormidesmis sp. RL_2_1]|nr:ABC transporter substrate-binding protein [Phormidesmis sp. RL_2_1]
MSKKSELPALIAALVVTAGLLGGGAWWLKNNVMGPEGSFIPPVGLGNDSSGSNDSSGNSGSARGTSSNAGDIDVAGADGRSGQSILPGAVTAAKQAGLDAFAKGDYAAAEAAFSAALKEQRNDPEALIYLNNAAIGNDQAYTIAVAVPASPAVNPAMELLRGAAQAQTDINQAGGINGKPLKMLLLDDQDDEARAKAIASALIGDPAVLGVVGHFSSSTTLAVAESYEASGLTLVSPTSTAVKIAESGDYIFRTVPSDRLAAATLSRYVLNDLNQQKAAVFYTSESAYSQSVKSEFTTELLSNGGDVVAEVDVSTSGFSAGKAVQAAKAAGAEVIMLALNTATLDQANQIIALNQQDLPMVGGDSLYNPKVLDVGRQNALGLTVAVPWHILSHAQTPFVKESQALWGGDINWRTATAYDAVMTLAEGIKLDPTRPGVAAALAEPGLSIAGSTAPIRFLPTGDRNQASQLVTVQPGNRSGSGYDYVPVQ